MRSEGGGLAVGWWAALCFLLVRVFCCSCLPALSEIALWWGGAEGNLTVWFRRYRTSARGFLCAGQSCQLELFCYISKMIPIHNV